MANKVTTVTMENFISNWNAEFPDYTLSLEDLKKSHAVMGALFQIFDRLGIDRDAVLMPPTEKNLNENMVYYWDLLPVINMTRVINHLVSVMPQMATISVNHFLQPMAQTSHSILLLLFNLMAFNEQRLQSIAPYEEELFSFGEMVKALEDKKNSMFEMLNGQAEEKGKRAKRIEQMNQEIQELEEDLKQEELLMEQEKQELEPIIKEDEAMSILLDQKRATKEGLLAERERKRALRVYDADDIRAKAAQAAQNMKEAEEKLNSLKEIIAEKEMSLQILQMIKPNLDTANNLLQDIAKLKEQDLSDLDEDSREGQLQVLADELCELQAQANELRARAAHTRERRPHARAQRALLRNTAHSELKEEEDKDKKRRDFAVKAIQRTQEIKEQTAQYEQEKAQGFDTLRKVTQEYNDSIKSWEEALINLVIKVKSDIGKELADFNE